MNNKIQHTAYLPVQSPPGFAPQPGASNSVISLKNLRRIILFLSLLTTCATAKADQMAIWNFGPNGAGYTETVTLHALSTPPTLVFSGGLKDGNGKDGIGYTDSEN